MYKECKYCDGTTFGFPYGKDETCHCTTCGAEWWDISQEDARKIIDELEVEIREKDDNS